MIKYGLISETDARVLEKTIDLVCENSPNDTMICFLEVGVYSGQTAQGMYDYCETKKRAAFIKGIDNKKDGEDVKFVYNGLIIGNSNEVYYLVDDNCYDIVFIDGDHSFLGVISDFFAYAPKVKVGGFFAFHDTGKHIKPFTDFQHGFRGNPDAYISCRKALNAIGLIEKARDPYYFATENFSKFSDKWQLIFDEADENDRAGGICVFKKLY